MSSSPISEATNTAVPCVFDMMCRARRAHQAAQTSKGLGGMSLPYLGNIQPPGGFLKMFRITDDGGYSNQRFLPPMPSGNAAAWVLLAAVSGVYLMFQKKVLPLRYARVAAKVFFWPTIPFTILNRWNNYWTAIDKTVILGAAPLAVLGHVQHLHDMRVTGVVNMCDEYQGPESLYRSFGIKQLRLPTVDHTEPTLKDLHKAVAFIEERQRRGERVLVHCKAGHGRSAAVALCWLLTQNPGIPTHVLNQQLLQRRKVRKSLYSQKCVKAFARETLAKQEEQPPPARKGA